MTATNQAALTAAMSISTTGQERLVTVDKCELLRFSH
jgi:hypothetical protein